MPWLQGFEAMMDLGNGKLLWLIARSFGEEAVSERRGRTGEAVYLEQIYYLKTRYILCLGDYPGSST